MALDPSLRRHVEQDAKGVAASGAAALRSALKRVGGKAKAEGAGDPAAKAQKRARRAEQAALGLMGKPPGAFDEAALTQWLAQMSPEQLQKLGRMVWAARQQKERSPGLGRVEKQMERQGIRFDVHGGNVTVNIGPERGYDRGRNSAYSGRRSSYRSDWGRQLGRIKDFINGH